MRNYLFSVVLICIMLGCSTPKRTLNSNIYKDIYACQMSQDSFIGKSLNVYRTQLDYLDKFDYSSQNDTIYILELCGIQGEVLITIWNKNKILSYTNIERGYFESKNESLFEKYMIKLVSEWNIPEIKKRGTNSNMLPDDPICATKIVFTKGRYYIDCVFFKDFLICGRDVWPRIMMYPISTRSCRKTRRL